MRWLMLLLAFLPYCISAEEPIRVPLSTTSRLMKVYIGQVPVDSSRLPAGYGRSLRQVLEFDLNHNGSTRVAEEDSAIEQSLRDTSTSQPGDAARLRKLQAYYLVRAEVRAHQLYVHLFSLGSGKRTSIDPLPISGDLGRDRVQLHRVSDWIHQTLFGREGVATTHILYTVRTPNPRPGGEPWLSQVWECDYDGHNARPVTRGDDYCVTPQYVPADPGRRPSNMLFVSYKTGQPKIYLSSLSGQGTQRLTLLRGNQLMPTMNNARDLVAFVSDAAGNPDLFVQPFNPDAGAVGKPIQIFAVNGATQGSPAFSPDGSKVTWVSNHRGSPRIFLMDVPKLGWRGTQRTPKLLTRLNSENVTPCWSPDGSKLVYSSRVQGVRQIWVYDFATGREEAITKGAGHKENPSWAPNSLHIVYNTETNGVSEMYIVDLNTKSPTQISRGSGQTRFPAWEPRLS